MLAEGLDPENNADLTRYSLEVGRRFMRRASGLIRERRPEATIFYNARTRIEAEPAYGMKAELPSMTHVEIESLPSGFWGYNHFPLFVRYFNNLHGEILGMTGRFHRIWGDFGGVKAQAALDYECFSMLASGAKCSIGDQLHPRGVLERDVYARIGNTYASVEAKEPWCAGATPLAELGVLLTTSPTASGEIHKVSDADEGAMRMLLELQYQFQFVDREADLSRYAVVILPDTVALDDELADKVGAYLGDGGKLLLTGRAGLTPAGDAFALAEVGVDYLGQGEYDPDYIACGPAIAEGIPNLPIVQYGRGNRVRPRDGTDVLARTVIPFFQRSWRHFCSHYQTPYDRDSGLPAVTRKGDVMYIQSPLFAAYRNYAYPIHRDIVGNCLALLLPDRLVKAGLPSGGQVSLLDQGARKIAHLLYYVWQRRAPELDIIEDVVPLHDVELAVRTDQPPAKVYLAPEQQELEFAFDGGTAHCTVPVVRGHQMVVFEG
jgi:hypothetical protein